MRFQPPPPLVAMLATRGTLYRLFGADSPIFDVLAIGLLVYAGALVIVARAPLVGRRALMAFTFADGLWVVASAIVLLLFWTELTPLARIPGDRRGTRGRCVRDAAVPGGSQTPVRGGSSDPPDVDDRVFINL